MDNAHILFGIDITRNDITPEEVRDAIIPCCSAAHHIAESKQDPTSLAARDFGGMSIQKAEELLRKFFFEVGGDYNHPTKKALEDVIIKLAEYSKDFRSEAVIKKNKQDIWKLIDRLK